MARCKGWGVGGFGFRGLGNLGGYRDLGFKSLWLSMWISPVWLEDEPSPSPGRLRQGPGFLRYVLTLEWQVARF